MGTPPTVSLESLWEPFTEIETRLGLERAAGYTLRPRVPTDPTVQTDLTSAAGGTAPLDPRITPLVPALPAAEGFSVVEQIGKGGMAAVYRAVQTSLGRDVALKQITSTSGKSVKQFLAEAQVTGRLEHANVIPVHALLTARSGAPLLAMKLVEGTSWHDLLRGPARERPVELREHLQILLAVCNGVAYAHERGFLHRDLKPANVMVGEHGQVYVMDWGLAVGLDREVCHEAGIRHVLEAVEPAGTPAYLPPELARGDARAQGPTTDVYLLGSCLHEVLTRRHRHVGKTMAAILWAATRSEPFAYDAAVPGELAEIANRATSRDPADRHASVGAFAAAISAYLEHREAHALVDKGLALTVPLQELVAAPPGAGSEPERLAEAVRRHDEIVVLLEAALAMHPAESRAAQARRRASELLIGLALAAEDLTLALRLLPACDEATWRPRVEALRAQREARERELLVLREEARSNDWSELLRPTGNAFIVAGVLGALASVASQLALQIGGARVPAWVLAMWGAVAVLACGFIYWQLRGTGAQDTNVALRAQGTWAAVALGCFYVLLSNHLQAPRPYHDSHYSAVMIAIGFTTMALQSRRWLLIPGLLWFGVAVAMAVFSEYRVIVYGVGWLFGMGGVGLAVRLGARL